MLAAVGTSTVWASTTSPIGAGTVLRSADQGGTWKQVLGTRKHPLALETFSAADAEHAWLVAMTTTRATGIGITVYRTIDGGRRWSSAALPIPDTLR